MKLVEFPDYAQAAQLLWDLGLVPMSGKYIDEATAFEHSGSSSVLGAGTPAAHRSLRQHMRGTDLHRDGVDGPQNDVVGDSYASAASSSTAEQRRLAAAAGGSGSSGGGYSGSSDNVYGAIVKHAPRGEAAAKLPKVPFNGTMFLTTEDPKVIEEADAWGKENHWKVMYTNLFDRYGSGCMIV